MTKYPILQRAIIMLVFLLLASCTSMHSVEKGLTPEQIAQLIKPGDKVVIHTVDDEKYLMVVESITPEKISGNDKSFSFNKIKEIKKEEIDAWKTYKKIIHADASISAVLLTLAILNSL